MRTGIKLLLFTLFILVYADVNSQIKQDKIDIYNCILIEHFKADSVNTLLLIDSTCTANINLKHKDIDSILVKHLEFRNTDFDSIIAFRKSYKNHSKNKTIVPVELAIDNRLKYFKEDSLISLWNSNPDTLDFDNSFFWDYLYNNLKVEGFIQFSSPFFYKSNFVIVYCSIIQGPLAGYGANYFLVKENNTWSILKEKWAFVM